MVYDSHTKLPPTIVYFTIRAKFDTYFNFLAKGILWPVARGPWTFLGVKNHWILSKIGQGRPQHMPNQCLTTRARPPTITFFCPTPSI